ncbi:MAG: AAA family ATPase [Thermodesulfobacteriota bacterium]|nr:AAA family ATPase [Thermodesulfobacteriota bacterium]
MERYNSKAIKEDLQRKMVFVGGPRQVGKTTMALQILGGDETHPAYLNWDDLHDKRKISKGYLPPNQPLIVLDEIHKYKGWRDLIKIKGLTIKTKAGLSSLSPVRPGLIIIAKEATPSRGDITTTGCTPFHSMN